MITKPKHKKPQKTPNLDLEATKTYSDLQVVKNLSQNHMSQTQKPCQMSTKPKHKKLHKTPNLDLETTKTHLDLQVVKMIFITKSHLTNTKIMSNDHKTKTQKTA